MPTNPLTWWRRRQAARYLAQLEAPYRSALAIPGVSEAAIRAYVMKRSETVTLIDTKGHRIQIIVSHDDAH